MGAQVDWTALPIIIEMLGVDDPEQLIRHVTLIRDTPSESNG